MLVKRLSAHTIEHVTLVKNLRCDDVRPNVGRDKAFRSRRLDKLVEMERPSLKVRPPVCRRADHLEQLSVGLEQMMSISTYNTIKVFREILHFLQPDTCDFFSVAFKALQSKETHPSRPPVGSH